MKIEALTDRLNAKCRGKCPKEEKLRGVLSEAVQGVVAAKLAGGESGDPTSKKVMVLAMACQMLWNSLEDAKAEIERLKKAAGGTS